MSKEPGIYFVSGVSSVGKTTTLKQLKSLLPGEYDVRDLDERGVPDGGGAGWLASETRHWIDVANENALKGKVTVICGFANPDVLENIHKDTDVPATLILLNASGDTIRQRLIERYPTEESVKEIMRASGTTLEVFIENCASFAPQLEAIFKKHNMPTVDTDGKTPEEVAAAVSGLITSVH